MQLLARDNRGNIITRVGRLIQNTDATYAANQLLTAFELAEHDIRRAGPWPILDRAVPWTVLLTAGYEDGTVTTTVDSATVTGSGTAWTSAMIGRKFRVNGDTRYYRIATVPSATSLTLDEAYENADLDGSNKTYKIYQDEYNLPSELFGIYAIRSMKNTTPFRRKNMQDFFFADPSADVMADPYYYDFFTSPVENQPAGASTIKINSSHASSDDTKQVLIRGIVSSVPDSETVTIATNTVTSSKSYSRIDSITKLATWTGSLTAYSNSDNITVHRIPPEYLQMLVRKIWVYPYPKYNTRLYVNGWEAPAFLLTANDVPILPSDLYVHKTYGHILTIMGETKRALAQHQYANLQLELEKIAQNADADLYVEAKGDSKYALGST